MRILGIAGSLRRGSHNRKLLRAAGQALPPGAELVEWEGLGSLPIFDEDMENDPPAIVQDFLDEVEAADAILISTPEYNHSIPGQLKNALDWLSRPHATNPLRRKPAAVVGASTGAFGAVWAQAETRKVLQAIGAHVIDRELPVTFADDAFTQDGGLVEPGLTDELDSIVGELVMAARPLEKVA
jgi:chromate reductase